MKKIIKFLKSLLPESHSWKDIECAKIKTAPTVQIGWHVPKMEVINTVLKNSNVTVTYMSSGNNIFIEQVEGGEAVLEAQLTVTQRMFTRINNTLKKSGIEVIDKEFFTAWEDALIEAQGKGKKTYHSKRYPTKKTK